MWFSLIDVLLNVKLVKMKKSMKMIDLKLIVLIELIYWKYYFVIIISL